MFNRVSYKVPVTHKEMETIRIQTSNTSSDYQIPLIVISTADGDEKFSVHTKSFFNKNVIIRSIAKFSGTFTFGKSIDLGKSSRPKIIGLKQNISKSLKISTNTTAPSLFVLDTTTVRLDKDFNTYIGSVQINGEIGVTSGLQVVSREIVYGNESNNVTLPYSTPGKFGSVRISMASEISNTSMPSFNLMSPDDAGHSITIVNDPVRFLSYSINPVGKNNMPTVSLNYKKSGNGFIIDSNIRVVECSSISSNNWICSRKTTFGDPSFRYDAQVTKGFTDGKMINMGISGTMKLAIDKMIFKAARKGNNDVHLSQHGLKLQGGKITLDGPHLTSGKGIHIDVPVLTRGNGLRIEQVNDEIDQDFSIFSLKMWIHLDVLTG